MNLESTTPSTRFDDTTLSTSIEAFVRLLEPGDVILFDKLAALSGIIQWADNRPVNHAAIYVGDGRIVEATIKDDPAGGIYPTDLQTLLTASVEDSHRREFELLIVRTATAMRIRNVDEPRGAVAQRALDYVDKPQEKFATMDLMYLLPLVLQRAYPNGLLPDNVALPVRADIVMVLSRLLQAPLAREAASNISTREWTCSELVVKVHREAGVKLELPGNTLWNLVHEPATARTNRSLAGQVRRLDPSSILPAALLDRLSSRGSGRLVDAAVSLLNRKSQRIASEYLAQLVDRLESLHRTDGHGLDKDSLVTPGDLWSSPSLHTVAVYHQCAPGDTERRIHDELFGGRQHSSSSA